MQLIQPLFWKKPNIAAYFILPFSLIYFILYRIYNLFIKTRKVSIPVICIGNNVIGGGGKTPIVSALARFFIQIGANPCIITRGYKGSAVKRNKVIIVEADSDWHEVGDEALLLRRDAAVFVCKNRVLAAELAIQKSHDIIILDDGLQNQSIYKNLNVLVIDRRLRYPFGNGLLFPAGPLREIQLDTAKHHPLHLKITDNKRGKNDVHITYQASQKIKNRKVWVMCGIARPEKFIDTVRKMGGIIVAQTIFADHHCYKIEQLESILSQARECNAIVTTTEKDLMKIPTILHSKLAVIIMEVKLPKFFLDICQKIYKEKD